MDVEDGSDLNSSGNERDVTNERKLDLADDAIDVESDDLSVSQEGSHLPDEEDVEQGVHDRIDIDSSIPNSVYIVDDSPQEERQRKRRRVSASPLPSSTASQADSADVIDTAASTAHVNERLCIEDSEDNQSAFSSSASDDPRHLSDTDLDITKALQQPVFHAAPRFKPIEMVTLVDNLPLAFSPQRRGAKYLPGGLAAELQGLLSEIKGQEFEEEAVPLRIHVAQVRPGQRMYLVRNGGADGGKCENFILAGEGRLTGLGRPDEVELGSVVAVRQPTWDVELDGETWTVACDWAVE